MHRPDERWFNANGFCLNPSKSKCLLLSRTEKAYHAPDIFIRGNKIDFVKSTSNLDIIFKDRLTWSNHINVILGKVYGLFRKLYVVIDSTPFDICMQTFLIPALLSVYQKFSQTVIDRNSTWLIKTLPDMYLLSNVKTLLLREMT